MREYQLRSTACFVLPRPVYIQCIWMIRDIERMEELVLNSDDSWNDPVSSAAREKLEAIDAALALVPEEYRDGIILNITDKLPFGSGAHDNTWKKWKQRFVYELAVNMMMV